LAGLYIHIPFCEHKCIYCNFYSIENLETKDRFIEALLKEIVLRANALQASKYAALEYSTIFFGGGTPSLLSPDEINKILVSLKANFKVPATAEITMECNPGALTLGYLQGYKDCGINRLSFGVQSFNDEELKFLTRIHSADEARTAITHAKKYFDNVSLDLIFALPNQTLEQWQSNLREGIDLGTKHFSAYSLIFEEGTPLNAMRLNREVLPTNEETDADMYSCTMETLCNAGFQQYEVSNYSLQGFHSKHNLKYWTRETYISFGPSSHSFLRNGLDADMQGNLIESSQKDINFYGGLRWANFSNQRTYLIEIEEQNRLPVASRELLSSQNIFEEFVMLSLRSVGIKLADYWSITRTNLLDSAKQTVDFLLQKQYATLTESRLKLTPQGYHFADRISFKLIDEFFSKNHLV